MQHFEALDWCYKHFTIPRVRTCKRDDQKCLLQYNKLPLGKVEQMYRRCANTTAVVFGIVFNASLLLTLKHG